LALYRKGVLSKSSQMGRRVVCKEVGVWGASPQKHYSQWGAAGIKNEIMTQRRKGMTAATHLCLAYHNQKKKEGPAPPSSKVPLGAGARTWGRRTHGGVQRGSCVPRSPFVRKEGYQVGSRYYTRQTIGLSRSGRDFTGGHGLGKLRKT